MNIDKKIEILADHTFNVMIRSKRAYELGEKEKYTPVTQVFMFDSPELDKEAMEKEALRFFHDLFTKDKERGCTAVIWRSCKASDDEVEVRYVALTPYEVWDLAKGDRSKDHLHQPHNHTFHQVMEDMLG